jgi:hypothetical protein
MIEDLK